MFTGYWLDPDATDVAIADGWFLTDDLGYFDERGYLHLSGRRTHTARSGGLRIDLDLVSRVIEELEGVESALVDVIEDDRFGESIVARVKLKQGVTRGSDDILLELRQRLDRKSMPKHLEVTTIAKNPPRLS